MKIGITMGDPVGIGPEIILKALSNTRVQSFADPVVLGDEGLLTKELKNLRIKAKIHSLQNAQEKTRKGFINVLNFSHLDPNNLHYGEPNESSAISSLTYIDHAIRLAQEKIIDGFVTSPVNKHSIFKIFNGFKGHTEYIAQKTGSKNPVMLMVSPKIKTIPLTTHTALSTVPHKISIDLIVDTLKTANESLKLYFGIKKPKIGVAGLNPHSGEEIFGTEENEVIYPAVKIARSIGIDANGPYPADSIFLKALDGTFDLILAMYHDQALIPVKTSFFHKVVNVTLGIPIIRTSVGHGVAYDIAGKNQASCESMLLAIKLAASMAMKSKHKGKLNAYDKIWN